MVAAPQYCTWTLIGLITKQTYTKDCYMSDVAAGSLRFDDGSGNASATSATFFTLGEPAMLIDIAVHTGMTDTECFQITANGIPVGSTIRYAAHLDSLNSRPKLALRFAAGARISGIQRAD